MERKEVLAVRAPDRRVITRAESRKSVRFHGEFSYSGDSRYLLLKWF